MAQPVPKNVLEGIKYIRATGLINMLAVNVVVSLCHEFDFHEAGVWISTHQQEYLKGIIQGFEEGPNEPAR